MNKHSLYKSILLATSALGAGLAIPAVAQEASGMMALEEIVVTARRREERLQDVPISMTVFNQEQMNKANIVSAGDLATYTPSLQANQRFGTDATTFAIRGFSQELRTTSSVGVYFAEVIAPRGGNTSQSGDGAGPGDFFDLENVQVLKGPQGTLFGRNTTGGAVLISPKKPTEELEGYAEVSGGNYDMWRGQGVVNVPVSDTFRMRLGIDSQQRDGYLNNISNIGPSDFADVDYTAFRGSAVWDITDTLENYTILKYTDSQNNGSPGSIFVCGPAAFGGLCSADLAGREAAGNNGFHDVYSFVPEPTSEVEQGQIINTTTWEVQDNLTIKNILAYAELETNSRGAIYGTNWNFPLRNASNQIIGTQPLLFQMVGLRDDRATSDSQTFVEEIQVQGVSMDDRLTWQTGLYYEKSEPNNEYGAQSPSQISCDIATVSSPNPNDWRCNNLIGAGSVANTPGEVEYENKAIYAQGTYEFTEQWSGTLGLRYTDDETTGWTQEDIYYFPRVASGGYYPYASKYTEVREPETSSEEPTWVVGVDYKPTDDMLVYGKYARGYRQGSVNLASIAEWDTHEPEQVDTYEIGAKTSFEGQFPGTFNVAYFYNDFQDQQVQFGYFRSTGVGTTSIINAGASTIWGLEAEGSVMLTDRLTLIAGYTYLDTEVDELAIPAQPYPASIAPGRSLSVTTAEGEPLSYSPENKLVFTASYLLPIDDTLGTMTADVSYIFTDEMQAVSKATSPYATLDSYDLVNLNLNWANVAGGPVDLALFGTNVTDEEYITFLTGNYNSTGMESGQVGQPRMYGMRVKYNF